MPMCKVKILDGMLREREHKKIYHTHPSSSEPKPLQHILCLGLHGRKMLCRYLIFYGFLDYLNITQLPSKMA